MAKIYRRHLRRKKRRTTTHTPKMPPRIPVRFPWTSRGLNNASLGALDPTLSIRSFSATPAALALGPQSPNYIEVPKPLQPTFPLDPVVKGHLPIPRDIFKTRSKLPKESPKLLGSSSRRPKNVKTPGPYSPDADYQLYKRRLADKRRDALREGVKQLHERKVEAESMFQQKLEKSYAEKLARATAPPRETDLLTATSIQKGLRDFLAGTLPESSKKHNVPARRAAYQRRVEKIQAVRQQRLHDLYVNAREFLVEESQLDEAIDKCFGSEEKPVGWAANGTQGLRSEGMEGLSPWHGPMPEGVGDMLQKLKGGEGVGLARERVRKVAESLTGGKM
jgi:hypothetical protein